MYFHLNEEQRTFREEVRQLVLKHVAPFAARWDEAESFPFEAVCALGERGLLGITVPVAYGGLGLDPVSYALAIEEVARHDGSMALTLASHNTLACGHLLLAGSEEQKRRYLPALARGEMLGAWALTEAESGSDAAALKTTAEPDGEGWLLNGAKMFVTQGTVAGLYVILARTAPGARQHGISAFLVEAGTPGLKPATPLKKLGCRASDTAALRLDHVRLPRECLLGELHHGFVDALKLLDKGRIGIGAMAVGLARGALEESLAYAQKRKQFGKPIASFQAVQWLLADMATEIDAARLLVHRAAMLQAEGRPSTRESSMAKLYASEVATRAASKAVQIHGGYGYLRTFPVERILRDARICEIGEGTSEVQRMVIARELLKS
jgi:alkylation response protein AidB-like acyl-CoA dehydrogenase